MIAEPRRIDLSFSEALKPNLSFSDKPKTTEGVDVPKRDPNKILIASSTNRFRDSIEIKREFAKFSLSNAWYLHLTLPEVTYTWSFQIS